MSGTRLAAPGRGEPGTADTGGRELVTGSRPAPAPAVLVACSHGTAAPDGRRAIADLRARIAALRPGLRVVEAYVDVQRPAVGDVVRHLVGRGQRCVVVPLLLSTGYHVRVDIAAAVAGTGGAAGAARPLGPDPVLADVLVDRLARAELRPDDDVVLAAAGSSDPAAALDVNRVAAALTDRLGRTVTTGYLSAAQPSVDDAVTAARTGRRSAVPGGTGRVVVATYLLSPGFFADRLAELATKAGAHRITAPLAGHPALPRLALQRYDETLSRRAGTVGAR